MGPFIFLYGWMIVDGQMPFQSSGWIHTLI